jgi:hypothetical protein
LDAQGQQSRHEGLVNVRRWRRVPSNRPSPHPGVSVDNPCGQLYAKAALSGRSGSLKRRPQGPASQLSSSRFMLYSWQEPLIHRL